MVSFPLPSVFCQWFDVLPQTSIFLLYCVRPGLMPLPCNGIPVLNSFISHCFPSVQIHYNCTGYFSRLLEDIWLRSGYAGKVAFSNNRDICIAQRMKHIKNSLFSGITLLLHLNYD